MEKRRKGGKGGREKRKREEVWYRMLTEQRRG